MRQYAEYSTLWLLGQYLGWTEILRREVQFLDFESSQKNRALQTALDKVASELATDSLGRTFAVFRTSQRAIGELMIVEAESAEGTKRHVYLGYAEFVDRVGGAAFSDWFAPLGRDLNLISKTRKYGRFVRVQRALVDVIDLLDPDRVRYPTADRRGKLPVPIREPDRPEVDGCARLARFTAYAAEYGVAKQEFPAAVLAEWAHRYRLASLRGESDADAWSYIEKDRPLGARLVVHAMYRRGRIEIYGAAAPPGWAKALRLARAKLPLAAGGLRFARSRRRARTIANDLLRRFDRPVVR